MQTPTIGRAFRVMRAAAFLAGTYAFGVVLLLTMLMLWTREWVGAVEYVSELHVFTFGVLFSAAFLLLAVARRVGFAMIWFLLMGAWAWLLTNAVQQYVLAMFVLWSILALPFYLLGAIGFPGRRVLPLGRWTVPIPAAVAVLWVLLLLLTLAVTPSEWLFLASAIDGSFGMPPESLLRLVPVVWAPAPFIFSVEALLRLWPDKASQVAPRPAPGAA